MGSVGDFGTTLHCMIQLQDELSEIVMADPSPVSFDEVSYLVVAGRGPPCQDSTIAIWTVKRCL